MSDQTAQTLEAKRRRPGVAVLGGVSFAAIAKFAVAAAIVGAIAYIAFEHSTRWHRFHLLVIAFITATYLAVLLRGRFRDAMAVTASLLFCLAAAEPYCVDRFITSVDINTPGHNGPRPILGWGPIRPGVIHNTKLDTATGRVIWDRDYTIDAHLRRQVVSPLDGPAVVFTGGSDTFGTGLPDAETLPQIFADLTDRRMRVVNLGFPGYGPQQTLRGLETGLFDDALKDGRLLVIETTPWQVSRTSCTLDYMGAAPHYEVENGQPTFLGPCKDSWSLAWRAFSAISSIPHFFVIRAEQQPRPEAIDLYLAIILRSAAIAREKFGVPTVVLYQPGEDFLKPTGYSDVQLAQRLRVAGLGVVDGRLNPADFPGQDLEIPGEGHPTGVTNRAWATRLKEYFDSSIAPAR
ncbi:MAG: hypothetical protein ACHQK9_23865 [Reyranellales bacterium]